MTKEWVIEMIFDKQKNTIQILWRQNPVFSLMSQWEVKQSKINSISTHAHVLFSISFPFLVSWIACLNASSSNHKGNWRQLAFSSVHFSSECKYLLYPFWKRFRQRRIWQAINTIISYAKLFRNEIIQLVMMSLYNIASLRDRVRPQGVYGDRKISIVHPFPVSFLCVNQIEASISSREQTPGHLSFLTSVYTNPLLLFGAKLSECSTHPNDSVGDLAELRPCSKEEVCNKLYPIETV